MQALTSATGRQWRIPRAPGLALGLVEASGDIDSIALNRDDVSRPVERLQSDRLSVPNSRSHAASCGQGGQKEAFRL